MNETTAAAKSKSGYTLAVSFWMANPPDLSFFSVHCSKSSNTNSNFKVQPHVVGAQGPFVLLRARFYGCWKDEYFMYRAHETPSLEWIAPPDYDKHDSLSMVSEFAILQSGFDCLHYRLIALCDAQPDYQLQIYSSETKIWSTRTLLNPCPGVKAIVPEKVISLGENLLGWVDFSCGLLECDLKLEAPYVRFVPFPKPLPENKDKLEKTSKTGVPARWLRDLTCVHGVLKFIEIENRFKETVKPISSDSEFLFDLDLIMSLMHKNMDEKEKTRVGWRVVVWTRAVWSHWWSKEHTFDVADFLVDESTYPPLMSGDESVGKLTLSDMYSDFPNLSPEGDILYLKSMVEPNDPNGWVVAVHLESKTMEARLYNFEHPDPSKHVFRPCTLLNHVNMSPGTEVSACVKLTQGCSAANDTDNKSVRVDAHIFSKSRGEPLLRRALADINGTRDEAQSIVQNYHISQDRPVRNMHIEAKRKSQGHWLISMVHEMKLRVSYRIIFHRTVLLETCI